MRRPSILLLGLFALGLPNQVGAFEVFPVTEADKQFLSQVSDAVKRQDVDWIAGHMAYPLSVTSSKGKRVVKTKEEFATIVKRELTASVRAKIAAGSKKLLFKNWQGVMIGDGVLWFSQYRVNDREPWEYRIAAIGFFAFQESSSPSTDGPP